jgi:hypothetical protein
LGKYREVMMKASYWKTIAVAVFIAGTLGGCQDTSRIEELQQNLAAVTKERDELIAERDLLKGDVSQLRNELASAQAGYEADTAELAEYQKLGRPDDLRARLGIKP